MKKLFLNDVTAFYVKCAASINQLRGLKDFSLVCVNL